MSLHRVSSRFSKTILAQCRFYLPRHHLPTPPFSSNSLIGSQNKVVASHLALLQHSSIHTSVFQRFGFSSSASPEAAEKENAESGSEGTNQKELSDSEEQLSMEDLVKLVEEKEELLKARDREMEEIKDKFLRSYAEIQNVKDRTTREAENSKKFAIQSFAKGLLDVADNLNRASSIAKESFSKIDSSRDAAGAVPLLKTLLEGVEMTEKQLAEVFKKYGVEKYEPTDEQFDPNKHNAVFQVPDSSKPADMVAVVLKPGYMLHDRVLRPADVGVTVQGS